MTEAIDRIAEAIASAENHNSDTMYADMARAAVAATFAEINAALDKRDWCPCCGYDGLWPRGSGGERGWEEFLASLTSRPNPVVGGGNVG